MIDNETYFVVSVLQEIFQTEKFESDPKKYLEKHRVQIAGIGRLFKYLGLAEHDDRPGLGWKPTRPLLVIIAKALKGPAEMTEQLPSRLGDFVVDSMLDIACAGTTNRCDRHRIIRLAKDFLVTVGLLDVDDIEGYVPSGILIELFLDAYFARGKVEKAR